jgi:DNA-binding MarR family transcriptional regulator
MDHLLVQRTPIPELTDPVGGLDDLVHQRFRLAILTIAVEGGPVQFGYLQRELDLTPGNLGRHLNVLEEAGLIKVSKGFTGRRPWTAIAITSLGRKALRAEIAVLKGIVLRVEQVETKRRSALPRTMAPAATPRLSSS